MVTLVHLEIRATFTVHVSPYTPAFCDWAFAYEHKEDRVNGPHHVADDVTSTARDPIPDDVDMVMTYGRPKGIIDLCPQGNVGCENLFRVIRRVKPTTHCFGYVHEGSGTTVIDWTKPAIERPAVYRYFEGYPPDKPYLGR